MDQEEQLENTYISAITGAKLRKCREDKGLSQPQLAGLIDATQAQIDHYEKGGLDMPVTRLFDIARVLEVTVAELLGE